MDINKPRLDRFKVLDLIVGARSTNCTNIPAILRIVPHPENRHHHEDPVQLCSDGKFRTECRIKGDGDDTVGKIEDYSLIKVTNAKIVKKHQSDKKILEISCEVLINGRHIEEFMTSDMATFEEKNNEEITIDIKNDAFDIIDPDKLSLMRNIVHDDKLRYNLWQQARNQEHTDVKFVFPDGETLYAHKAVLSSQSDVFRTHFTQDPPFQDQHVISIEDATKDIFHDFLHYIYRGFTYFYNVRHQLDLLYLATKYFTEDLRSRTTYFLENNLFETVFNTYRPYTLPSIRYLDIFRFYKVSPDTYASLSDVDICFRKNAFCMIHDPEFLDISFNDMKEFLSLDPPLEVDPNHLLEALLGWAVHQKHTLQNSQVEGKDEDEDKIKQFKDLKENVQILLDTIDLKDTTLDALGELNPNKNNITDIIDLAALEKNIEQNMKVKCAHLLTPCLDDAHIFVQSNPIFWVTSYASADISSILDKGDDQIVYSKKIKLQFLTAKVQILFQRESKEFAKEGEDNTGFITTIITSIPSNVQEAEVDLFMDFVLYNRLGKPYNHTIEYNLNGLPHEEIHISTKTRDIKSFKVHNWEKLINPNKTGRSLVYFQLNVEGKVIRP